MQFLFKGTLLSFWRREGGKKRLWRKALGNRSRGLSARNGQNTVRQETESQGRISGRQPRVPSLRSHKTGRRRKKGRRGRHPGAPGGQGCPTSPAPHPPCLGSTRVRAQASAERPPGPDGAGRGLRCAGRAGGSPPLPPAGPGAPTAVRRLLGPRPPRPPHAPRPPGRTPGGPAGRSRGSARQQSPRRGRAA